MATAVQVRHHLGLHVSLLTSQTQLSTARCGVLMPFRWRGVSALSWVTDKRTSLKLGHVPRLALFQHTGQRVTIRWTSSGFLSMFHNTSVSTRTLGERRFQNLFFAQTLGPRFWARILSKMQDSQLHCSLRDGVSSVPCSSAGMITSGGKVPCGLSAAPESVSALYEAWKGNTLTMSIWRDYSSARLDSFFESRGLARDAVFLFSLLSPGCKFLESSRSPGALVASGCSSSHVFSAPCFRSSCSWPSRFSQFPLWWQFSSLPRHRVARFYSFPSREFLESHWIAEGCTSCSTCGRGAGVFHSLRHLDLRARRRRGSFHWSLRGELGIRTQSWTLLASPLRYGVLGSRVHPHGHFRLCSRLRSVAGLEGLMAMAVVRRLRFLLC